MDKKRPMQSKEFRVYTPLCLIFFVIYLIAGIAEANYLLAWAFGIAIFYCFGVTTNNIAYRKGYGEYSMHHFSWGFFFGFFALLYFATIPPAWEHPEYINAKSIYFQ